ncbi:MAG: dihydropteroate synthase [Candidatus Cloacimonetes bacterium HGW-Cloacimonetes-1]|nr:MAG: dihydropteroate synthase [Candidatus Cloacimonetes bacterium HGW-Cloacimonetes-1]
MGILNITEDSFSDGNQYIQTDRALVHAAEMIRDQVQIIDIGAESTRPGAKPIAENIQIERLLPVINGIKSAHQIKLSIDTRKASVAAAALAVGADMINDISALRDDPQMVDLLADHPETEIVLMHMQGSPEDMQNRPQYKDVISEVKAFFTERITYCLNHGIKMQNIIIDPGIGFGKTLEHNLLLMANLHQFRPICSRILLGTSRKSFIDLIDPSSVSERLSGSLASVMYAICDGVEILRVHDVKEHHQFIKVLSEVSAMRI